LLCVYLAANKLFYLAYVLTAPQSTSTW